MLRPFGSFLLVFTFLGLIVHIKGVVELFGSAAIALFVVDSALACFGKQANAIKAPQDLLL